MLLLRSNSQLQLKSPQRILVIIALLSALQLGCNWFRNQAAPSAAEVVPSTAATEGAWDENGTVAGYEKMIQRYGDVLQRDPTDITALTETAYAYSKIAWIRHFNAQHDLWARLRRNADSTSEIQTLDQQADSFLQRARGVDSTKDIVLAVDSIIQRSRGHNLEASTAAQQAYQPDSLNPRVLEAYEITRIDPKESRDLYRRCVSAAPNNAYYWWQRGNFETDTAEKEGSYKRAVELSPQYALPKISQAMSRWLFSMERLKGLGEIANASAEFGAFARHNRLLSRIDVAGVILFWLLALLTFGARSLRWFWLLGVYFVLRGVITIGPGISDRSMLFAGLRETITYLISTVIIILFWDFARAWFWPDSTWALHRLSRRVTRGFLAVVRSILRLPPEPTRADFSYVLIFGELLLLNWFVHQVFTRLGRWW